MEAISKDLFSGPSLVLSVFIFSNEVPQTAWLQQQKLVSQFWRPEVQNHGVGRTMLAVEVMGGVCSRPVLESASSMAVIVEL